MLTLQKFNYIEKYMKKIFLLTAMCCISLGLLAQEEKPEIDKPASPELSALQTASSLAKYGYTMQSPTALIEAARIFGTTPVQAGNFEIVEASYDSAVITEKENTISFEPKQLLAEAKKYAGKDKILLALIGKVENEIAQGGAMTRGAVGGPRYHKDRVLGKDRDCYKVKFWAKEMAEVCVSGDGDTDLDLYVYDSNNNLIGSDTDYSDECVVRWVPKWTGEFIIKIVNRGALYNNYTIWTN